MYRIIGTLVLATGIALLGSRVSAQQDGDLEGVKAANRAFDAFYDAVSARDLAQMDAVWAHESYVRAIHPTSASVDAGWQMVRAGFQNLFEGFAEISVTMPEPSVRVAENFAWVTGEEPFKGRQSSGEEIAVTLLGTNVFERSGERWLMVHHHVSVAQPPQQ
jgi:ketosteroid isomerase-like protein